MKSVRKFLKVYLIVKDKNNSMYKHKGYVNKVLGGPDSTDTATTNGFSWELMILIEL